MAGLDNLKPFQPGYDERRGSKPKGAIHLSTRIKNLLEDERFTPDNVDTTKITTPMEAIIATAITKAQQGDSRWAKWLSDAGYGQKFELDHSGEIATGANDPVLAAEFVNFIKSKR